MTKTFVGAAAASLLLCHSATSFAGLIFTQTTTTDGEPTSVTKVWSEGNKAKSETVESAIDNPFMPPGSYMLANGQDMFLVNPTARTFAPFDVAGMMQNTSQMTSNVAITDVKVEKTIDEPGESIAGYATRHYQFKSSWSMGVNGVPMKTDTNVVEDVWTTDAIDLPAGPAAAAIALPSALADLAEARAERQVEGFTLRQVTVQSSKSNMGAMGGGGLGARMAQRMLGGAGGGAPSATTTTMEISAIQEAAIPADTFTIPAGYRETSLSQSGPAMPSLNTVEEPAVPSLNNLDN